ncbi:hypothetical protein J7M22_17630 [Candidatus Poribacteria bacterium]|nr:hypothetical protein [Candidatus Poribacteria bacterium]
MLGSILLAIITAFAPPIVEVQTTVHLLDVGFYDVGYRIGNRPVVHLGLGWSGHFEPVAGVSYSPWGQRDDTPALLMHPPWRRGAGTAWADYRFRLPEGVRAKFIFSCAMLRRQDVLKGSDGVTYSVYLNGFRRFRKHIKSDRWERHEIDLSDLAGEVFSLRLEVNAGPRNDASWDYSLWGDPRIEIEGNEMKPKLPSISDTSLEGLSNDPKRGVLPSVHYPFQNGARKINGGKFELRYEGEDVILRYTIEPLAGLFPANVEVRIDDGEIFYVFGGGGITSEGGEVKVRDVKVDSFDGKRLKLRYDLLCGGEPKTAFGMFRIRGKTLLFEFETKDGWVSSVNFGFPIAALRREIFVPYLFSAKVYYLPRQTAFVSVYIDFTGSEGSYLEGGMVRYERKTDGTRNPVHEVCLFTVSRELGEVLPNIPWNPSPYIDEIADRAVFDIWGGHLARDAEWVRELGSYGISRAIMLKHVWQRYGYDSHLPTTVPANKALGGDEGARALSEACRGNGWLFALHENYIDFYPDSHEWNPQDVALYPNGKMRKAWFNRGTGEQSYAYKSGAMVKYARLYSPEIHRRYRTTAAFYDVNSCAPPWLHLDCDSQVPFAAKLRDRMRGNIELFKFAHQAHHGPFFGEGNKHFWWAGLVDGVEAQVVRKEYAPWLLDFDLLKIHPQMVNHGMGYWSRWQVDENARWNGLPAPEKMDKYRAMELAFGHAAFIPTELWHSLDWVLKEYYLTRPIQARYASSKVKRILYEVNGEMVPSSVALALNAPLDRVYIEYKSGLRLWVNGRKEVWCVEGRLLPQFGFLALSDDHLEAWTALEPKEGRFAVDYCLDGKGSPEPFIFVNGRGFPPLAGSFCEIKPSVEVSPLSGRRFRITYKFKIGEHGLRELNSRDLILFVHFVNFDLSKRDDGIMFQHDHRPSPETRSWKSNSTVIDGPYDIAIPDGVPDGQYEIRLGLYDKAGRVRMEGGDDGSARYIVGAIKVKGDKVEFEPVLPRKPIGVEGRINPDGGAVDFGEVITAGAVVILPKREKLMLVPHPRAESFEIGLRPEKIVFSLGISDQFREISRAEAISADGKVLSRIPLRRDGKVIYLRTVPGAAVILIYPVR